MSWRCNNLILNGLCLNYPLLAFLFYFFFQYKGIDHLLVKMAKYTLPIPVLLVVHLCSFSAGKYNNHNLTKKIPYFCSIKEASDRKPSILSLWMETIEKGILSGNKSISGWMDDIFANMFVSFCSIVIGFDIYNDPG